MTTVSFKRAGLVAAIAALTGVAACSNKGQTIDETLKADLAAAGGNSGGGDIQLAPSSNRNQVVVSAIEGGPTAKPAPAAPKRVVKPTPKPAPRVAEKQQPAQAPAPAPIPVQEAPVAHEPAPVQQQPAPAPVQQQQAPRQDNRVYKTEGEIFRQMPWIRP